MKLTMQECIFDIKLTNRQYEEKATEKSEPIVENLTIELKVGGNQLLPIDDCQKPQDEPYNA